MKSEVIIVLKRWAHSLSKYGKLDRYNLETEMDIIDRYIRKN